MRAPFHMAVIGGKPPPHERDACTLPVAGEREAHLAAQWASATGWRTMVLSFSGAERLGSPR